MASDPSPWRAVGKRMSRTDRPVMVIGISADVKADRSVAVVNDVLLNFGVGLFLLFLLLLEAGEFTDDAGFALCAGGVVGLFADGLEQLVGGHVVGIDVDGVEGVLRRLGPFALVAV